jgi:hypothetical protein
MVPGLFLSGPRDFLFVAAFALPMTESYQYALPKLAPENRNPMKRNQIEFANIRHRVFAAL